MTDRPPDSRTTAGRPWLEAPAGLPAHDGAECLICRNVVIGTSYRWRGRFPLMADMVIEWAHPECVSGDGTKIVEELKL